MFKLQFKDHPERSIWLVGERISLGAAAGNDVVLDGLGINDLHAEILIEPHGLTLKSQAGSCVVNDLPVDGEHSLQANDELRIGKERLLIIDPKRVNKAPSANNGQSTANVAARAAIANWRLIPDHPKLQERDFSISSRCVIGRSQHCEFTVPYKLLSREHAALWVKEGELLLEDMGSANGCFVNGERVQQAKLNSGDKVAFAKLVFSVEGPDTAINEVPEVNKEEMNKTMVRPAIDLETELQRIRQHKEEGDLGFSLDLDDEDNNTAPSSESTGRFRWPLIIMVLIALVATVFWLTPLAELL